jgi:hypothetical protein
MSFWAESIDDGGEAARLWDRRGEIILQEMASTLTTRALGRDELEAMRTRLRSHDFDTLPQRALLLDAVCKQLAKVAGMDQWMVPADRLPAAPNDLSTLEP